ncbi:MAG: hypothetical protein ACQEV7_12535 [Bacillota bacterium]
MTKIIQKLAEAMTSKWFEISLKKIMMKQQFQRFDSMYGRKNSPIPK